MKNKKHWYDGLFYDKVIAPNQDFSFGLVEDFVGEDMTVLDIGCGTGRLSFRLMDKCKRIDGIDLSGRNISVARKKLEKFPAGKIAFYLGDAYDFLKESSVCYDAAVLTYVLHEMNEIERIRLLKLISTKTKKIIIADYLVPRKRGAVNFMNEAVEFLAGKEHYRNFRSYINNYGLSGLVSQAGLRIKSEFRDIPVTSHFMVLTKKE